jgi:hypothetical protein
VLCWLIVSSLSTSPFDASAQGQTEPTFEAPLASPLLVLLAADDPSAVATERQLVAELQLALDGISIEQIAIERDDFLTITLPEQLEVVQPLIQRFLAKAAVWVTSGGTSGHLIQFVVSESGSATVRTVEAGSPEELALAIRELMDSTYLFELDNKKKEPEPPPRFSLGTQVGLNGGMAGHEGASLYGGLGIEARFRFTGGLYGGLVIAGKLGPREVEEDGILLGWRVEPGVFFTYTFRIGRFGAGPFMHLSALGSSINMVLGEGDHDTYHWWAFRGALGLELFMEISTKMSLVLDWTVGGISTNGRFKRRSTNTTVVITPRIDYCFTLGFITNVI